MNSNENNNDRFNSYNNVESEINIRQKNMNFQTKHLLTERNSSRKNLDKFSKYMGCFTDKNDINLKFLSNYTSENMKSN